MTFPLRLRQTVLLMGVLAAFALPTARAQEAGHPHLDAVPVPVIENAPGAFSATLSRYTCDPQKCRLPHCQCAQTEPPAGLAPAQTPQFLLLTFDDCVNSMSDDEVHSLFDGSLKNPDGRPVPLTYFLSLENCPEGLRTDAALVRERYRTGNEIAIHTRTHTTYDTTSAVAWRAEMLAVRDFIAANDIGRGVGFRAPFVATNAAMFESLRNLNFLYDSSVFESPFYSPLSRGPGQLIWPYTLDTWSNEPALRAQNCEQFVPYNKCAATPQPGLWEIPLYYYVTDADPQKSRYLGAFDVGNPVYNPGSPALTPDSLVQVLDLQFNARYNNNRAPMNFYFHAPNLSDPGRRNAYRVVLEAALSRGDVWAVTMQGLVEWMQAPVPVSEMAAWYDAYCSRHTCTLRGTAAEDNVAQQTARLRVFPNPAATVATAEVHTEAPGAVVTIHNVHGQEVRRHHLSSSGRQHVALDLADLASGLYLVH
ncbi:MAG TPA: polysaccharide deacetylase family protein, partial [Rhodothermales bacterium]|nr:polysaccharide deacetylase family protein [Rhodothermales bacterium]